MEFIAFILSLPAVFLAILNIYDRINNKRNTKKENMLIVGDNNNQNVITKNISYNVTNNYENNYKNQYYTEDTTTVSLYEIFIFLLLILAFVLYKENKYMIYFISLFSGIIYFINSIKFWKLRKSIKINYIITFSSFLISFLLLLIYNIFDLSKVNTQFNNLLIPLYNITGTFILLAFTSLFIWNIVKHLLNLLLCRFACTRNCVLKTFECSKIEMFLSLVFVFASLLLFVVFIIK